MKCKHQQLVNFWNEIKAWQISATPAGGECKWLRRLLSEGKSSLGRRLTLLVPETIYHHDTGTTSSSKRQAALPLKLIAVRVACSLASRCDELWVGGVIYDHLRRQTAAGSAIKGHKCQHGGWLMRLLASIMRLDRSRRVASTHPRAVKAGSTGVSRSTSSASRKKKLERFRVDEHLRCSHGEFATWKFISRFAASTSSQKCFSHHAVGGW